MDKRHVRLTEERQPKPVEFDPANCQCLPAVTGLREAIPCLQAGCKISERIVSKRLRRPNTYTISIGEYHS
ncbi:hypothetical protein EVC24_143 [Rhizobium phage RHph_I4]|nr:hypothetical protein EVC24_143 [Rhizobium phage RHph_I4]